LKRFRQPTRNRFTEQNRRSALRQLTRTVHWLHRAGPGRKEMRRWLFETARPELGLPPTLWWRSSTDCEAVAELAFEEAARVFGAAVEEG